MCVTIKLNVMVTFATFVLNFVNINVKMWDLQFNFGEFFFFFQKANLATQFKVVLFE